MAKQLVEGPLTDLYKGLAEINYKGPNIKISRKPEAVLAFDVNTPLQFVEVKIKLFPILEESVRRSIYRDKDPEKNIIESKM